MAEIESGERVVVGREPLRARASRRRSLQGASSILSVDESAGREQVERLRAHRATRNKSEVESGAARRCATRSRPGANVMEASVRCAHAGVTTGEWSDALRAVFGEYRAPTGVDAAVGAALRRGAARGAAQARRRGQRRSSAGA